MCMCVSLDFVHFLPPETFVILGPQYVCYYSHMPLGLGMRAFLGHCVFVCVFGVYFLPQFKLWCLWGHNSFFDSYMTLGLPGLSLGIVCMYMCYFYQKTWGIVGPQLFVGPPLQGRDIVSRVIMEYTYWFQVIFPLRN